MIDNSHAGGDDNGDDDDGDGGGHVSVSAVSFRKNLLFSA